jgi:hypothetical protein
MPKTSKKRVTHSKYYNTLFPDDVMIEAFGNIQPTPSERANYFKSMWYEWSDYEIVMPMRTGLERTLHEILEPHMKALFEWQVRAEMKQDGRMDDNNVTSNKRYMKKVLVLRFKSSDLCALGKILLS